MTTGLAIAVMVVVLVGARVIWSSRRRVALEGYAKQAVAELFGNNSDRPEVRVAWSYGYPRFDVIFGSAQLLNSARNDGTTDALLASIQLRCEGLGPSRRPFDATTGVLFRAKDGASPTPPPTKMG